VNHYPKDAYVGIVLLILAWVLLLLIVGLSLLPSPSAALIVLVILGTVVYFRYNERLRSAWFWKNLESQAKECNAPAGSFLSRSLKDQHAFTIDLCLFMAGAWKTSPVLVLRLVDLLPPGTSETISLGDWMYLIDRLTSENPDDLYQRVEDILWEIAENHID